MLFSKQSDFRSFISATCHLLADVCWKPKFLELRICRPEFPNGFQFLSQKLKISNNFLFESEYGLFLVMISKLLLPLSNTLYPMWAEPV